MVRKNWIRSCVREEREALLFSIDSMIKEIAKATPIPGEIGDEYDQARESLGRLRLKLENELRQF